jgi:hypothetical protein
MDNVCAFITRCNIFINYITNQRIKKNTKSLFNLNFINLFGSLPLLTNLSKPISYMAISQTNLLLNFIKIVLSSTEIPNPISHFLFFDLLVYIILYRVNYLWFGHITIKSTNFQLLYLPPKSIPIQEAKVSF